MTVILNQRRDIDLDAALRAGWQGEAVEIGAAAIARMQASRAAFERYIADPDVVVYGVTSGYGQNAGRRLSVAERKTHALRPPLAAQANTGEPFPARVVRLMTLARLANFLEGHAAVRPELAIAVARLLSAGPLPSVPRDGAVSAGEILPLGWLFADLAAAIGTQEKEALALINGAPVAAALAADGVLAARRRLPVIEATFALLAEAYKAPLAHFSPEVSALSGDPHELAAAQSLAALWQGGTPDRRPYQAPVSFRILPKMLGRLRRQIAELEEVASLSLAQVSDNPVFLPPDAAHPNGHVVSTGGYHNARAWPALNALAMAMADLCTLADRLLAKVLDGKTSGLPDQLNEGTGDERHFGTLGFALVGYGEKARRAAQAVFLPGSESGGFVQNDVAVPTVLAWEGLEDASRMVELCLGALAVTASQALHVTQRPAPPALVGLLNQIRSAAPVMREVGSPGVLAAAATAALRREMDIPG